MRRVGRCGGILAIALFAACAGRPPPIPVPPGGGGTVDSKRALTFQRRADSFYLRLENRRFNTLETYNDFVLRDHFRSPSLFFDYYADLAQAFTERFFEKSRPWAVRVEDFVFEDPETVQVQVVFHGKDGRPLRPGNTRLIRIDRWERFEETWWLKPGRL